MKRVSIIINGRVQGVGYRYFVSSAASDTSITGYVQNQSDGSVLVRAEGEKGALNKFIEELKVGPSTGRVDTCCVQWQPYEGLFDDFQVKA